ncbi:MAG: stage 0 sporulation family protein, partial [Phascolarctobacterium sp.]|nr:stage 0 sporulation family protein [Candidatus Phascolarctobacterium equi]
PLCCATFLGDSVPVSIRMAKNQNLSLNPTKISGICGRLLCCLQYADDNYTEGNKRSPQREQQFVVPKIGTMVATSMGDGRVVGINRENKTVNVQLAPNNVVAVGWDEVVTAGEVND